MLDVDLPEDVSLHSGTFRHSSVRRCTVSAAASLYQPNMKAVQIRHTDPALCCTCELSITECLMKQTQADTLI